MVILHVGSCDIYAMSCRQNMSSKTVWIFITANCRQAHVNIHTVLSQIFYLTLTRITTKLISTPVSAVLYQDLQTLIKFLFLFYFLMKNY